MMSLSASLPTSLSASLRSRKRGRESEDSADGKLRAATPPPSPAPAVPRGLPLDPLVKARTRRARAHAELGAPRPRRASRPSLRRP